MRFRFCRDCDCPDWLLAEIQILSRIEPVALKDVATSVARSIIGDKLEYERLQKLLSQNGLDESSIQASTAAVRWILSNASGALIEAQVLDSELQQLGLPKEQSVALSDTFSEEREDMIKALREQTLKASRGVISGYDIKRVQMGEEYQPILQLNLEGNVLDQEKGYTVQESGSFAEKKSEKLSLHLSGDQLGALVYELEDAYKHMTEMTDS